MTSNGSETRSEPADAANLVATITAIVSALREAEGGDLSVRVDLSLSERDPIGALASAVNFMIESLAERREQTLSYQHELEAQIGMIEKQRAAIRELSTPIIEVWRGVLCVPIVGVLDSSRASEMTSALLTAIVDKKAEFSIIDITGIDAMDTRATDHFLRMARAVRLLGAECVLSGVNPAVARTITHMGVELDGIKSHRSLRDALQHYVRNARGSRARAKATRGREGDR
ncbi:MAG TPA: STAS domain-containing protein [Polyangiaceae bacterium]|nr:STAS domain-containing protein [Polyangiaceae bacterium]